MLDKMNAAKQLSVIFLVSGVHGPSCRFRALQYLPYLRARGVHADVADLSVSPLRRWRILQSTARYDRVVVHRAFLSPIEQRRLRRAAGGYVFDFDDAILFRDSSARRFESWQRRLRFKRMVEGARAVIAGNDYLCALAAPHNTQVTVIPTAIDVSRYPRRSSWSGCVPTIGWIGTGINLMYLETVLPALIRVARGRTGAKLKIISDGFVDAPGLEVIKKRWVLDDEVDDVMSLQVGIMPLLDDPWTRGKCALKILQYFAASVPVVCSPVGGNLSVVEHDRNGYFARTEDEWAERIEELLEDEDTCRRFGAAGRKTVEERYAVQPALDRLLEVLA